jgi:hypothetical protein
MRIDCGRLNVWLDLSATIWKQCAEISTKDLAIDGLPPEIRDEKSSSNLQTAAPPHR